MNKIMYLIVLLLLTTHVYSENVKDQNLKVLKKIVNQYLENKNYSDVTKIKVYSISKLEKVELSSFEYEVFIKYPDKIHLKIKKGDLGINLIYNGNELFLHDPIQNFYTIIQKMELNNR